MKTWECKECGKEVVSKTKPKGACSCGAYAWKPLGGKGSRHTPGPWRTRNTNQLVIDTEDGRRIADTDWPDRSQGGLAPYGELEANARLIAAAPEMLAELRKIHDFLKKSQAIAKEGRDLDCVDAFGAFGTAKDVIAAVIAKAEGRKND